MSAQLSWRRLGWLIRYDVIDGSRALLIASAAVAGLMLVAAMIGVRYDPSDLPFYQGWFAAALFIWGSIVSSYAFDELHDRTQNAAYLLLPASALEKTIARLLYSTVLFIAYLLVFMTVVSLAIEAMNLLVFGRHNSLFSPFDGYVWMLIPYYIVVQALFFVGAAWFRKMHYIKTLLAIVVGCIGLASLSWVFLRLLLPPYFEANPSYWSALGALWPVLQIAWFAGLPLFCWYVAWLRVKETQVSHGV